MMLFIRRPSPCGTLDKLLDILDVLENSHQDNKQQDTEHQDMEELVLFQTLFAIVSIAGDKMGVALPLERVLDIVM